jgi:hypothetical protein
MMVRIICAYNTELIEQEIAHSRTRVIKHKSRQKHDGKTRPRRFKMSFSVASADSHALEPLIKVQRIRIDRLGVHWALVAAIVDHVGRRVRREIRAIVGRRDDGGGRRRLIAIAIAEVASLIHVDPARQKSNMRNEISRKNKEKRAKSRAGGEKGDFWISSSDKKTFLNAFLSLWGVRVLFFICSSTFATVCRVQLGSDWICLSAHHRPSMGTDARKAAI